MTATLTKPKLKTIKDINLDIREVERNHRDMTDTAVNKALKFYRQCIQYLERGPTTEFVQKELVQINGLVKKIKGLTEYDEWKNANRDLVENSKNPLATYRSYMGLSKLRTHQRTLRYLLK